MKIPPTWLSNGYVVLFACLPWSVEADFGTWAMRMPSEPLIGFLCLGLFLLLAQTPKLLLRVLSSQYLLQISLVGIIWMAVSAWFSSLPIVAWKYWVVTAAHWWVFAVGISIWPALWRRAFPWFAASMAGVAIYTLVHHAFYHFRFDQALLAPMPFFPDHTMWASAVVMVLCLVGIPLIQAMPHDKRRQKPPIQIAQVTILATALIFSTCRAAWASLVMAGLAYLFLIFKPRARLILLLGLFIFGLGIYSMVQPCRLDVSAQERLNRWSCALRMAAEKPIVGYGPGTYKFQYLGFQKPEEMTRISLVVPIAKRGPDNFGRGGGAHSEYLQVLSESGWPGFLLLISLAFSTLWLGFSKANGMNVLPFFLALCAFWAHAVLNDFLHDDRIAALMWGSMVMLWIARKED